MAAAADPSIQPIVEEVILAPTESYTVIAAGSLANNALEAIITTDIRRNIATAAIVRVVHGAYAAVDIPVDIYLTGDGVIANAEPVIAGLAYGDYTAQLQATPSDYWVTVTAAGDKSVVAFDSGGTLALDGDVNYTVIARDPAEGQAGMPVIDLTILTDSGTGNEPDTIEPIPITPGDASTCSATLGPDGERLDWPSISSAGGVISDVLNSAAGESCTAPGWVFCINAVCEEEPTVDADMYNGKPFVNCSCWQPTNTDLSIVPLGPDSGANCVLGQDAFAGAKGGGDMCQAIRDGALISTYGPEGTLRGGTPISDGDAPFSLQAAECRPNTPWAWCWGAPCERDESSPTGITCHCPYMTSTNNIPQPISLAGQSACEADPCTQGLFNSMPAGQSPNSTPACAVEPGA